MPYSPLHLLLRTTLGEVAWCLEELGGSESLWGSGTESTFSFLSLLMYLLAVTALMTLDFQCWAQESLLSQPSKGNTYLSLEEGRQQPFRVLSCVPFCVSVFPSGRLGRGRGIYRQIIEFFELEGPWKVEKGPGGHEKGGRNTIWHSPQRFLFKACGKTCISVCLLLGVGREIMCLSFVLEGRDHESLTWWVGKILGASILGEPAT